MPTEEDKKLAEMSGVQPETTEAVPETEQIIEEKPTETAEEKPEEKPEAKPEEQTEFERLTGRFKSKEEFDTFFEQHEISVSESKKLREEFDLTKKQLEALQNTNPLAEHEDLYKIAQLSKETGIKDYTLLGKVISKDLTSISDIDAVRLKLILDNQELAENQKVLDRRLSKMYKIERPEGYDEMDEYERKAIDEEIEDAKFQLTIDAKKARREMTDMVGKIKLPETPKVEDIAAKRQATAGEWKGDFREITDQFKSIEVPVSTGKDRKSLTVQIDIPNDKTKERVMTEVAQYIIESGLKPTDDNKKLIRDLVKARYQSLASEYLFSEVARKVRTMSDDEWRSVVINPSTEKVAAKPAERQLSDEDRKINEMTTTKK